MSEFEKELRGVAREQLKAGELGWRQIVDAGWTGIEVPEALGGAGATFAETAVVLRELGRAAARTPLFGTILAVGMLIAVEPSDLRDDLLRGTVDGSCRLSAVSLDTRDDTLTADIPFRLDERLAGEAGLVPDAPGATHLLVRALDRHGTPVIALVEQGAGLTRPTETLDETRSFGHVRADGHAVEGVLRDVDVSDLAALAIAWDSLGIAEAVLEKTVTHAKEREQFGRPIGSFQAVKHQCADLLVQVTVARRLLLEAPASMAKSFAGELGVRAAGTAMQLHGGMGYTWESGLHAYLKRAVLNRSLYGSPAAHRRRIAARYTA